MRIKFGGDGGDDPEERGGAKGEEAQQEGETRVVPRLDEDHLRRVLEKVCP